jgi:hypothetical protein
MSSAPSGPSTADLEALAGYAAVLADGIERSIGPWVERSVEIVCEKSGVMVTGKLRQQARTAGAEATAEIAPRVRALLALDIDEQRLGPLELLRSAVRWPTQVLRDLGIAAASRDESAKAMFPDDDYDLTPASFGDLDPALHEPGLVWGAAKAHVFLARRRAAGQLS